MFQNLQRGSQVWLLHKGMTPYYEVGMVEQAPMMPMMGYYQAMPVDITVRVGEKVIPYKQLPPNAEVANVIQQSSGEEVCVACSRDCVNGEIQQLIQKSVDAINSVEAHKQRIVACKALLEQLNPEKVREQKQVEEMNSLRNQVTDLSNMVAELTAQLKAKGMSSQNDGGNKK